MGIPDLCGHGSDAHLDDQIHESLVIIAGDGRVRPNDQGAVDASREVDVLACRWGGVTLGQGLSLQGLLGLINPLPCACPAFKAWPGSAPTALFLSPQGVLLHPSFLPPRLCLCCCHCQGHWGISPLILTLILEGPPNFSPPCSP